MLHPQVDWGAVTYADFTEAYDFKKKYICNSSYYTNHLPTAPPTALPTGTTTTLNSANLCTLPTKSYVSIFTPTPSTPTKHNSQDGAQKASYLPLPTLQWQLIFDPPKTMAAPFLISLLMLPPTTFITAITFIDVSYHEGHHYFIIFLPPPSHPLPSLRRSV